MFAFLVYNDMPEKDFVANKPLVAEENYEPSINSQRGLEEWLPENKAEIERKAAISKPKPTLSEEAKSHGITEEQMMCAQKAAAYEVAASSRDHGVPKFFAGAGLDAIRHLTPWHTSYIINLVYNDPQFASMRGDNFRIHMLAKCLRGEDIAPD
jgi:hypothetical protein